jgi:hypothetical protein
LSAAKWEPSPRQPFPADFKKTQAAHFLEQMRQDGGTAGLPRPACLAWRAAPGMGLVPRTSNRRLFQPDGYGAGWQSRHPNQANAGVHPQKPPLFIEGVLILLFFICILALFC